MRCKNCNAEIPEGKLFCEECGKEVRIVPDYNVLDEDILATFIEDPKEKAARMERQKERDRASDISPEKPSAPIASGAKKKDRKKSVAIIAIVVLVLLISGITGFYIYSHSYSYYMNVASLYDSSEEYESAILQYEKALLKEPEDREAALYMANDYYALKDYDKAEELLLPLVKKDPSDAEAYKSLLAIYGSTGSYDKMEEILSNAASQEIIALFNEYVMDKPKFSRKEGTYGDDVDIKLSCSGDYDIYYTLDGSAPSVTNGEIYKAPIAVSDGTTVISAVCVDKNGRNGEPVSATYTVKYEPPEYPTVSPESGIYYEPIFITITSDAPGAKIYYTWDGSVPTASSLQYTEPLLAPEGNNILSVLVVDKHGMTSDVLKMNYRYIP